MKYIEYLLVLIILILSIIITNSLLSRYITLNNNTIIIENDIISNPNIYINNEFIWTKEDIETMEVVIENIKANNIDNNENNDKWDFYKLEFNDKSFLLSDDNKSYTYWFISKKIKNNVLYLYSHNSYKYTENSWYFLYNNLKLWDIIKFNDLIEYKVIYTELINFDDEKDKKINIKNNADIIYFTCTPKWWNIRKIYHLERYNN